MSSPAYLGSRPARRSRRGIVHNAPVAAAKMMTPAGRARE